MRSQPPAQQQPILPAVNVLGLLPPALNPVQQNDAPLNADQPVPVVPDQLAQPIVNDQLAQPVANDLAQAQLLVDLLAQPVVNDQPLAQPLLDARPLSPALGNDQLAQPVVNDSLPRPLLDARPLAQPLNDNHFAQPMGNIQQAQALPNVRAPRQPARNPRNLNNDPRQPLLGNNRPAQPSLWSRFKSWAGSLFTRDEATSFATANTPGPYTGVTGTGGVATQLAGANAFANRVNATALGHAATGFQVGTGAADILGIYGAVQDVRQGRAAANDPNANPLQRYEGRSRRKRGLADTAVTGVDLLSQGSSVASSALSSGSAALAPLGVASSVGGSLVNTAVAARSGWRGGRALMHWNRGRDTANALQSGALAAPSGAVGSAIDYHQSQMKKRGARQILGAVGATAGAVGGALATAMLFGALASTPVGWGLIAAGGLVAAGIGAYKLYRWYKKRKEGTLHTERAAHATTLVDALHGGPANDQAAARHLLETSFGTQYANRIAGSAGAQRRAAIDSVARKIHGW